MNDRSISPAAAYIRRQYRLHWLLAGILIGALTALSAVFIEALRPDFFELHCHSSPQRSDFSRTLVCREIPREARR